MTFESLFRSAARLMLAGALALSVDAVAQETKQAPVNQATTHQKADNLQLLVTKSVSARRIEESGDVEANANLETARDLVAEAHEDLAAGRVEEADRKLNEALRLVNGETRRLSQDQTKDSQAKRVYDKRLKSVNAFMAAYDRVSTEKGNGTAFQTQIAKIKQQVAAAEALAGKGDYEKAKEVLDQAYNATRASIRDMRQGDRLVRTLNFATAQDEYKYEIDRNDSHFMLLQLAVDQQQLPKSVMPRIEKQRSAAEQLRGEAEKQAAGGDYPTAIDTLNKSTDALLKAIRLTGLSLPG